MTRNIPVEAEEENKAVQFTWNDRVGWWVPDTLFKRLFRHLPPEDWPTLFTFPAMTTAELQAALKEQEKFKK